MKDLLFEQLERLAGVPGAPGHETPVTDCMREVLSPLADGVETDHLGNLYVHRKGSRPGPRLMVAVHADQIGGVVKYIDERGFIRFEKLGAQGLGRWTAWDCGSSTGALPGR